MNLLVFLSNRCNMSCGYCFLDLNKPPAILLGLEAAKRACSEHLRRHPKGGARFTFLGGEPLIHFPLLVKAVEHIRSEAGAGARVGVVTNGVLACPERLRRLQELGVALTASLDGQAPSHDRHRRLHGRPESALEAALKALEPCDKGAVSVNMVVCQDTAGSLLRNVEFLRSRGFRRLSFHLNVLEAWTEEGLRELRASMEGLVRYARAVEAAIPGSLEFVHLDSFSAGRRGGGPDHSYDDIVLGADGRYYPCDAFFALPYGSISHWSVGDARSGLDGGAREDFHRRARRFIHSHIERDRHYSCPREAYVYALVKGGDPAEAVRRFHRADNIVGDALAALASRGAIAHA